MPKSDAAPVPTTIADGDVLAELHRLMVGHREEAQRKLNRALKAGLPPKVAMVKAARPIKAAMQARGKYLSELPYATA